MIKKIATLLLVILCFIQCVYAQQAICSRCNNIITGKHYINKNGTKTCTPCYNETMKCFKCRQLITSKYYFDDHKNKLCKSCRDADWRCMKCGKVIEGSYYPEKNKKLCQSCYNANHKCTICTNVIGGQYYTDNRGQKYCAKCHKATPLCKGNCGAPVAANLPYTSKQFPLCKNCDKSAVQATDRHRIAQIYASVSHHVRASTGLSMDLPASDIILTGYAGLQKIHPSRDNPNGFCHYDGKKSIIYIREKMPEEETFATLAHEYGHAIHFHFGKSNCTPIFTEGFAEWISYKAMINAGNTKSAKSRLTRSNPDHKHYQEGLIKMLEYEKLHGVEGVIQLMKTKTNF